MRDRSLLALSFLLSACGGAGSHVDPADASPDPDGGGRVCDADGDGWNGAACGGVDCDDADSAIHPETVDRVGDGVDEDCDGIDGLDQDSDGSAAEAAGGGDCDDADPAIHPGAPDPEGDGVDTDCDGTDGRDADGDGFAGGAGPDLDCDDGDDAVHPGAPDGAWTLEVPLERATAVMDVVVGPDGVVHVLYASGLDLVHGWSGAGEWSSEVLASSVSGALAVGPDGVLHVVHGGRGELVHAWLDADWETEVVDEGTSAGLRPDVVVDADGALHVSYGFGQFPSSEERYATNAGGAWEIETLEAGVDSANAGSHSAIAVDGAGLVLLAYEDADGWLSFGTRDEAGWTLERIGGTAADVRLELLVDAPEIATYGVDLVEQGGAGWTRELVTGGWDVGLAIDGEDVHLAIADVDGAAMDTDLAYAWRHDGVWATEVVDTRGDAGWDARLAIGAGETHVVYRDYGGTELRWAHRGLPNGVDEDCDGVPW